MVSEIFELKKRLQQKGKVHHSYITMEMSYNQKINFGKYDKKVIYYITLVKQSRIKT